MFLNFPNKYPNISIVLKLSVLYTIIFSLCICIIFIVIFKITITHMCSAKDNWIEEETRELALLFSEVSLENLQKHMEDESYFAGVNNAFYSVRSNSGDILISSERKSFQIIIDRKNHFPWNGKATFFETVEETNNIFRILYLPVDDDHILQSIFSLKEIIDYQYDLIDLFVAAYITMIVIFCSVGVFMIKSTLKPVHTITSIAHEISQYNLSLRVPVKNNNDELNKLAHTFNIMLRKIEKLVTELKDMNANLAHDLRTLLSRVSINIEISLLEPRTNEEYQKILVTSLEECQRVVFILNTILDISEVETGILVFQKQEIEINSLVQQIIDAFIDIAKHKEIHLEYTSAAKDIYIEGELFRIRQAILNIVDNAIKYTPAHGKVKVSILEKIDTVIIQVEDTGIGIHEEAKPFIFKRFYREDQARSLKGSGLGLALSNAIITAHQGNIEVESNATKGSLFSICLPVKWERDQK